MPNPDNNNNMKFPYIYIIICVHDYIRYVYNFILKYLLNIDFYPPNFYLIMYILPYESIVLLLFLLFVN